MCPTNVPAVLVVDDDADTCRNFADILADLGYHVDTAGDGPSGLALLQARPYDVALLDYKMPGMTGLELYREIKQTRPETVALLVSAYTDAATREGALGAGVWQVLPKPADLPRLLGLVDEAVGQPLVLVVDDDAELCAGLWDVLRTRGYRVGLAGDARAAAARLSDHVYRVVLVDLRLPDADGAEVIRTARAAHPAARTVVITGHPPLSEPVENAGRAGADAVYYKPLDVDALLNALDRLAHEPRAERATPVGTGADSGRA